MAFDRETFAARMKAALTKAEAGPQGPPGPPGPPGDDGEPGPRPAHEWSGTKLRFEEADGTWGQWVDLGPRAEAARQAFAGGGPVNVSALLASLAAATSATPQRFVVEQDGVWRRATLEQVQAWLGTVVEEGPSLDFSVPANSMYVALLFD